MPRKERLRLEETQRLNAAQAQAARAAEAQRKKAAEDEPRRQTPHPAAAIAGTWTGWIGPPYANRDDAFRTFQVTLRPDGSIYCLWYWKADRDPAKRCTFSDNTVNLTTAADSAVRLTLTENTLQGTFRLANGEVSPVTVRRVQ